jgi:hypothetical protein
MAMDCSFKHREVDIRLQALALDPDENARWLLSLKRDLLQSVGVGYRQSHHD